jgi:hypothetical protein
LSRRHRNDTGVELVGQRFEQSWDRIPPVLRERLGFIEDDETGIERRDFQSLPVRWAGQALEELYERR